MKIDIKKYITLKNSLIGGGVLSVLGALGFGYAYSLDIENKIDLTKQIPLIVNELDVSTDKIILMNGVGNINIVEADVDKTKVIAYLTYEDGISDEKLGLSQMNLDIKDIADEGSNKDTIFIGANTLNGGAYFKYLEDNNLLDKVKIDYEILVNDNISELHIYNPVGNINAYNTDMSINIQSYYGNIALRGITPKSYVVASTNKGDVYVNIDDNKDLDYLSCVTSDGDINIDFDEKIQYVEGKSPSIPKINNDIFSPETYTDMYFEFLNHKGYDENEGVEIATKTKDGTVKITN